MSGWIKMGTGLRDHPKVVRMAGMLKSNCVHVVGGLHAVWSIFDEHSPDGLLEFYTLRVMDEKLGWKGFSAAMQSVGWLIESENGLQAPDYEEHNGPSAKRRALDKNRKESDRKEEAERTKSGKLSASEADKERTREEKNRKEEKGQRTSTVAASDPPPEVEGHSPTPAGLVCRAMRQAGVGDTNPGDPRLLALLQQGATLEEFTGIAAEAVKREIAKPFPWVLKTLEGRRAEAQRISLAPKAAAPATDTESRNAEARRLLGFDNPAPEGIANA